MFDKPKVSKSSPAPDSVREAAPSTATMSAAPAPVAARSAVIGPGIVIDGSISGSDNLLVEGSVKGSITLASHDVTIGKSGQVKADIIAKVIRIAGQVSGDLSGEEKVIIGGTGNVRGNVKSPRVVLEDGAIFKGSIDMDPGEAKATVKAVDSRPAVKPAPASGPSAELTAKGPDLALKSS
jgi:cytoskeletal protein CcmA (bactofilin family)